MCEHTLGQEHSNLDNFLKRLTWVTVAAVCTRAFVFLPACVLMAEL